MTQIKTVGIVGYGHFGQFVHELGQRFFPDITYRVYSRRQTPDEQIFFDLDQTAAADVVIICGAIHEFADQLAAVLERVRPDTIIVDVATVKKHTTELCRKHCGTQPFISTHPMFGPESYKKQQQDVAGFRIVVTDHNLSAQQYQAVKHILTTLTCSVIEMTADEHDQYLAETLFLTHYVAQSVVAAKFMRTPIDTVSFSYLMDAVESVKADGTLFADVYQFNPYCEAVATRLHQAQEKVHQRLTSADQ